MKKLVKVLIIVFVFVIILTGCTTNNKHIIEISLDKFKEMVANKETFAIYVGNKDCIHCEAYKPILEDVLNDYNITIYHIDNSKLSEEEYGDFKSYVNITGTPTVAFIIDGEEESTINRIVGETDKETTIKKFKDNGYIK